MSKPKPKLTLVPKAAPRRTVAETRARAEARDASNAVLSAANIVAGMLGFFADLADGKDIEDAARDQVKKGKRRAKAFVTIANTPEKDDES